MLYNDHNSIWRHIFGCASSYHDLGGIGAVDRNGIDNQLEGVGVDLSGFGDLTEVLVVHIGLHHSHAVGSQSASLV